MNQAARTPYRRFWLAVAAYVVPTFPLGYFWHLVFFQQNYHALRLYREDVIVPLGLTTMIIQSLLFAWLYPRLFSTSRAAWLASAAKFFAVFSVLAWSFTTLPVAAKYQMASISRFLALETSFTLVHFLVISLLIALAYRESESSESEINEAFLGDKEISRAEQTTSHLRPGAELWTCDAVA